MRSHYNSEGRMESGDVGLVIRNFPIKGVATHNQSQSGSFSFFLRWCWFLLPTTDRYAAYFSMTLLKVGSGMISTVLFYLSPAFRWWHIFNARNSRRFFPSFLFRHFNTTLQAHHSPWNIPDQFLLACPSAGSPGTSRSQNNLELSITRNALRHLEHYS